MKTVEKLIIPKECSGCGACVQACNHDVLEMKQNNEGFCYPYFLDADKCIDCGLCVKVCQTHQHLTNDEENITPISFVAQSKDRKNAKRSASGGVFWTIAKDWIENKHGVAFGAAFDSNHEVRHIFVDTIEGLKQLQGSKYVQSNVGTCFQKVKGLLQTGRQVLFSGTPCQVQGLRLFLRKDYPNLFTIDIICHGVTSPQLLTDYVKKVEQYENRKCITLKFRWKNPFFKSGSSFYMMMMMMNKGSRIVRIGKKDPYMNIYLSGYAFRESCYNCQFACPRRVGDITIGDCDSHKDYPDFHPSESNSTVIINTKNGAAFWNNDLKDLFEYIPMNLAREIECNKQLRKPFERPVQRDGIYNQIFSLNYEKIMMKYGRNQSEFGNVLTKIAMYLPATLRNLMARLR